MELTTLHRSTSSLIALTTLLVVSLLGCRDALRPVARNGVLDLRSWNFENNGKVYLDGEWAFYWKSFLPPGEIPDRHPPPSSLVHVPGRWNGTVIDGEPISGIGYATYRLTVLLPEAADEKFQIALRTRTLTSAHTLFVNGRRMSGAGIPGTDIGSTVPDHLTQVTVPDVNGDRMELTIHVANFHHAQGGIMERIILGSENEVRRIHHYYHDYEIFILGCIAVMGFYMLTLWSLRRRDLNALYLGLFSLILTVRVLSTGDKHWFTIAPELPWEFIIKAEYASFYLSIPIFLFFIRSMFPTVLARWLERIGVGLGALFTATVLIFPARIYTWTIEYFQAITVALGIGVIWVLITAIRRKLDDARMITLGFALLFPPVINDILHTSRVIYTGFVSLWGIMAFVLVQGCILARRNVRLFTKVEEQSIEQGRLIDELIKVHARLNVCRLGTILGLAKLVEYRDGNTGLHLERIREYSRLLAQALGEHPAYEDYITEEYVEDIYESSILHDIGKVGVKDSILLKPGRLTDEEFEIIREHTTKGHNILRDIERRIDNPSYLTLGREIAYGHHERWNGSGYPRGIKGTNIPLSARIVALADVYDALTSKRPYKDSFSHEKAVSIIHQERENHFDPDLVDVFLNVNEAFDQVRMKMHEAVWPG